MFETVLSNAPTVCYCANCDAELAKENKGRIGQRFICPNGTNHVAAVIRPPAGKSWLKLERVLIAFAERSPLRLFKEGAYAGRYHLARLTVLLVALRCITPSWSLLSILGLAVSMYLLFDLLVISTVATYIARNPTHPLRSLVLTLSTLFQVAIVFASVYWFLSEQYDSLYDRLDSVYYSIVTISTLGYGDIHPKAHVAFAKIAVMSELFIGLYVLAGLFSVLAGWSNSMPQPCNTPTLNEFLGEGDFASDGSGGSSK